MLLRRALLYLSTSGLARGFVSHFFLARRVARRFVAGETLDEAIAATRQLNQRGLLVTLDYLGESVHHADDTKEVVNTYITIVERIEAEDLKTSVSLKLTHLGLDISESLCVENLRRILEATQSHGVPVTIDMESSEYTDTTLRIYRTMRDEYGFDNVGTVIQSMLRRSQDDMQVLADEGARIRLCKGAYLEPASVAFPDKADVDQNYIDTMTQFLQKAPPAKLEIATHDENMIQAAEDLIKARSLPQAAYEFQMLYGIRSQRQDELVAEGYPTRVYVPFGEAWYPYFMRRLAERPANMWFFIRSLFRS